MSALRIHVLHAFDVGREIVLTEARAALGRAATVPHRALQSMTSPLELRAPYSGEAPSQGARAGESVLRVYEFGAVVWSLALSYDGGLDEATAAMRALREHPSDARLEAAARAAVADLVARLGAAVRGPAASPVAERYHAVELPDASFLAAPPAVLAALVRAGPASRTDEEIADAVAGRVSRSPREAAVLDVHACVFSSEDPGGVLDVLEFATVQLVEMRLLDMQLDQGLVRSYEALGRRPWRFLGRDLGTLGTIGAARIDAALLFEHVRNAPKLLAEPYLLRLYEAAAARRRLRAWDTALLHKLDTLGTLYEQFRDRAAIWRAEVLEWIVIVLILVSIAIPFVAPWLSH